jgi:hypothetical protein
MSIVAKGILVCAVGVLLLLLGTLVTLPMQTVHHLFGSLTDATNPPSPTGGPLDQEQETDSLLRLGLLD